MVPQTTLSTAFDHARAPRLEGITSILLKPREDAEASVRLRVERKDDTNSTDRITRQEEMEQVLPSASQRLPTSFLVRSLPHPWHHHLTWGAQNIAGTPKFSKNFSAHCRRLR